MALIVSHVAFRVAGDFFRLKAEATNPYMKPRTNI
jgi:hypothetical protein